MNAPAGADIVVKHDGSIHHAGNSRWKTGGVAAGGGALALLKFGGLSFLLKAYLIFSLVRLASLGGIAAIVGMAVILAVVAGAILRSRSRVAQ
jgi:hypothetical protein